MSSNGDGLDLVQRNVALGLPGAVTLAPLWRRLVAQILDQVLVFAPVILVALALGVRSSRDVTDHAFAINVAVITVAFSYDFVMIALLGRTVGKLALGTRVVRVDTAGPVLWSSAAIRALVPLAAGVIPGVGAFASMVVYATAFFDRRRQGWHDKAAGTIVVMHRFAVTR